MPSARRQQRLEALYEEQVSAWLQKEFFQKDVFVIVSRCILSESFGHLKVHISVWPDENGKNVLESLKKIKKDLRRYLGENVKTKFVPEIDFILDEGEKKRSEIENILKEI